MTANPTSATVEGEPVELLMRALSKFRVEDERDGMMRFKAELPPELGEPLMRALMRVEAELLLADAAGLGRGADERTHEQRGLDALVELTRRVSLRVQEGSVG